MTLSGTLVRSNRALAALVRCDPAELIGMAQQRFDLASGRLGAALERNTAVHEREFVRAASRLSRAALERKLEDEGKRLHQTNLRFNRTVRPNFDREELRVANLGKLLASLSPRAPLERGYALIHRTDGSLARSAEALASGEALVLEFRDGKRGAVVDGTPTPRPAKTKTTPPAQGSLF